MRIIINNEIIEFENRFENIEKIVELIDHSLTEKELDISHLIVDGNYVYEKFYEYLTDNIQTIQEVVVVVRTPTLIVNEAMVSAYDYIANAVMMIKPLSEAYYQSPQKSTWNSLANLFEGIQWIIETVQRIDGFENLEKIVNDYQIWNEYVQMTKGFSTVILELEEAMVNQDNVLIGDLLQYEIQPILEASEERLRFLIPTGGRHHAS